VTEHTDQLQRLLDVEEIEQLKARYFRYLDTQQWDRWGTVFTADVRMEVPEADAVLDGRDTVVSSVSAALEGARTVHHGHMPEIEITGPGTARGIWAMVDYVEWPGGDDGARSGMRGYGRYHDDYRREDGRWRISKTRLERLRIDPLT
jgi:hypothetical protein